MNAKDTDSLEGLLDKTTLQDFLETLAEICNEKADHLRANWQDNATAKLWDAAAKRVEFVAHCSAVAAVTVNY